MVGDFMYGILVTVMAAIDNVVYWAIEKVYEVFILISEAGVFDQATIQSFSNRIYIFLGIFMIFRISISLVTYIVNPSQMDDKNLGGGALIKNAAIALIGIVAVPYVFEAGYSLQRIVLKDNIIGNLILGIKYPNPTGEDATNNVNYAKQGGQLMAFQVLSAFISINEDVASKSCINEPVDSEGNWNAEICPGIGDMEVDFKGHSYKVSEYFEYMYSTDGKYYAFLTNPNLLKKVFEGTVNDVEIDAHLMNYSFLISTIAGAVVVWTLLMFCIDIAVRSVKLGFLQLIAPIPLMMRIDPQNGKKKFDAWVKECGKTYFDLFGRLAAIYFAIFIITAITENGLFNVAGTSNNVDNNWVKVFIIFGALIFAQQLPKLIGTILGIDLGKDGMGLSLGKRWKSTHPLASTAIAMGAGAVTGGLANAYAQSTLRKNRGLKFKENNPNATAAQVRSVAKYGHEYGLTGNANGVATSFGDKASNFFMNSARHVASDVSTVVGGSVSSAYHAGAADAKNHHQPFKSAQAGRNTSNTNRYKRDQRAKVPIADRAKDKMNKFAGNKDEYGNKDLLVKKGNFLEDKVGDSTSKERAMEMQQAEVFSKLRREQKMRQGDMDFFQNLANAKKVANSEEEFKSKEYEDVFNRVASFECSYDDYKKYASDRGFKEIMGLDEFKEAASVTCDVARANYTTEEYKKQAKTNSQLQEASGIDKK